MKQVDNKKKKLKFVGIYKYEAPERLLYILLRKWAAQWVWLCGAVVTCWNARRKSAVGATVRD